MSASLLLSGRYLAIATSLKGQQATFTDISRFSCRVSGIERPIRRFPAYSVEKLDVCEADRTLIAY
jgi:hypothetical protein